MYTHSFVEIFLEIFLEEFYSVIPKQLISVFNVLEFEMILNGLPFINVDDWEENTTYKGAYHKNH
jgi:E3 ubiquitin-protein ligase HUWE1